MTGQQETMVITKELKNGHTLQSSATTISHPPPRQTRCLDLAHLKTVEWVWDKHTTKDTFAYLRHHYNTLKSIVIVSWIIALIELVLISFWNIIHSINWPDWFMDILHKIDDVIEGILESIHRKVEWWYDKTSVRLMWARESAEDKADELLTKADEKIDKVLTRVDYLKIIIYDKFFFIYDSWKWVKTQYWNAYTDLTEPLTCIASKDDGELDKLSDDPGECSSKLTTRSDSIDSIDRSTDEDKDESDVRSVDEDVLSDASELSVMSGAKNIIAPGGRNMNRLEMKVEGRSKLAMEQRVITHLKLMRKHSIRFSQDLISYANLIVSPTMLPITNKVLGFLLSLGKKMKIPELFAKIQIMLSRHPYIAAPLAFIWLFYSTPIKFIYNQINNNKKKNNRRTRSRRQESLRRRKLALICDRKPDVVISAAVLKRSSEPNTASGNNIYNRKGNNPALMGIKEDEYRLIDSGVSSGPEEYIFNNSAGYRNSSELDDILEEQYGILINRTPPPQSRKIPKIRSPTLELKREHGTFNRSKSSPSFFPENEEFERSRKILNESRTRKHSGSYEDMRDRLNYNMKVTSSIMINKSLATYSNAKQDYESGPKKSPTTKTVSFMQE